MANNTNLVTSVVEKDIHCPYYNCEEALMAGLIHFVIALFVPVKEDVEQGIRRKKLKASGYLASVPSMPALPRSGGRCDLGALHHAEMAQR